MSESYQKISNQIRQDVLTMVHTAKSGHPGGSLSAADILTTLYFGKMNINTKNPRHYARDRFVLSKGHAAPVLYAALARRGYFATDEYKGFRQIGTMLQGHPDMKKVSGVDFSTGSLGQGFSAAVGMALAGRLDGLESRIYVLLGDGELNEGLVWEAAMAANHYRLSNLTAIVDYNGLQIDGKNEDVMGIDPLEDKWSSFGWHVLQVDGHDHHALLRAYDEAEEVSGPVVIIAKTVKGKGVSFMEDDPAWHGSAPNAEQYEIAMKELGGNC